MHLLHEICHRGPIYRVLSRFIGERLPYTNVARTAHVRRMRRAVRRESRLITRRVALAEAGQGTMKSALYGRFRAFDASC